eukprot:COSAG02_NODE_56316_length_286_cov_0.754011_1_plen_22_part_10
MDTSRQPAYTTGRIISVLFLIT